MRGQSQATRRERGSLLSVAGAGRPGPAGGAFPAGQVPPLQAWGSGFGHRVKHTLRRPTLSWPWGAGWILSPRINSFTSLQTRKHASCSERGSQLEKYRRPFMVASPL